MTDLKLLAHNQKPPIDPIPLLKNPNKVSIIAEFKRSSPSKGVINSDIDIIQQVKSYEYAGADMISVLTQESKFSGSLNDLKTVCTNVNIPVLRKDFIVDDYQILEARATGASCVLLIVRLFDWGKNGGYNKLRDLINYTHSLGMKALLECHNLEEIHTAKSFDVKLIGVNSRDLGDFNVNTGKSFDLIKAIGNNIVKVAESGVHTEEDFRNYALSGANCVLIGESLMKHSKPIEFIRNLIFIGKEVKQFGDDYLKDNFVNNHDENVEDQNFDDNNDINNVEGSVKSEQSNISNNSEFRDKSNANYKLSDNSDLSQIKGPYYGEFGGRFVPEALIHALDEFENAYSRLKDDLEFQNLYNELLKNYVGRPSALTQVPQFAAAIANEIQRNTGILSTPKVFLKREDLNHTGAHKINNALGQALLAKKMGKTRVVAETGAGQHGVATATVCALLGLECVVYMGEIDAERQALNVARMKLLGAKVVACKNGDKILKDAINEALRDWVENVENTHYLLGTVAGPHPYPEIGRDFQKIIGEEAKRQLSDFLPEHPLPDAVVACVGGGSNAIGIFNAFLDDHNVQLYGVEAGGRGVESGEHAVRFSEEYENAKNVGSKGVFQGAFSYLLQDENGQTLPTHSISAGLDYASIGPEHPFLRSINRVEYLYATDDEAMLGFSLLCKSEGIIPALESSHALAGSIKVLQKQIEQGNNSPVILINLSGRGDKDVVTAGKYFNLL